MLLTLLLNDSGLSVTADLSGTEVPNTRKNVSFHGVNFVRILVDCSVTTVTIRVDYSLDEQTWVTLASVVPLQTSAPTLSSWFPIPVAARADVVVRAVVTGLATSSLRFISLETHG